MRAAADGQHGMGNEKWTDSLEEVIPSTLAMMAVPSSRVTVRRTLLPVLSSPDETENSAVSARVDVTREFRTGCPEAPKSSHRTVAASAEPPVTAPVPTRMSGRKRMPLASERDDGDPARERPDRVLDVAHPHRIVAVRIAR